jgi:hypothetical protein
MAGPGRAATPVFSKGDVVYHSTYVKPGSPERRSLAVFSSKDGKNSFLLEASTGENATGHRFRKLYTVAGSNTSAAECSHASQSIPAANPTKPSQIAALT